MNLLLQDRKGAAVWYIQTPVVVSQNANSSYLFQGNQMGQKEKKLFMTLLCK